MLELPRKARAHLDPAQRRVNPARGLKTRGWLEVRAAPSAMVAAARELRS